MGWGDELMAAGEVSKIWEGEPVAILGTPRGSPRSHFAWDHNIQVLQGGHSWRQSIVNGPGHRPYHSSVDNKRWRWKPYKPIPAPMFFSTEELAFAGKLPNNFIALEPNYKEKVEAQNKFWGWEKWKILADLLQDHLLLQFGPKGTKTLPNVKLIETANPRLLAAALTKGRAFVSQEGGFHHTAASAGMPGVVIFGHFISPMVTGYDFHRNLFSGDLGCGSRVKCDLCRQYMEDLRPMTVYDELLKVIA